MVVGHSVHPSITPQCLGHVFNIDVGMSSHVSNGDVQVLEIINDIDVRVINSEHISKSANKFSQDASG